MAEKKQRKKKGTADKEAAPPEAAETAAPEGEVAPSETASEAAEAGTIGIEELKAQAQQRDEFLELLQRTRAEFSNYRKRIERERLEWGVRAVGDFVRKLLPVLDDFDRAIAHADEAADFETFVRGVRLVETKIYDVLKSNAVEPFEPKQGQPFDPAEHEAITVEETRELPDQTVSEVLLKGYRQHDRILRAAQVKVARNTAPEPEKETPTGERDAQPDTDRQENEPDANI